MKLREILIYKLKLKNYNVFLFLIHYILLLLDIAEVHFLCFITGLLIGMYFLEVNMPLCELGEKLMSLLI